MAGYLSHYLSLLTHFIPDFFLAFLALLSISGTALLLPAVRNSVLRIGFPFLSIAFYVFGATAIATVFLQPLIGIQLFTLLLIPFSIGGYASVWKRIVASLSSQRLFWITGILLSLGLSFFLYNLTYENGLHDEYYHHANIKLFFDFPTFPMLEPYRIGETISGYHTGLYLPVIGLKSLTGISVEKALDLTKLVLFIPAPFVLSILISKTLRISRWSAVVLLSLGFLLGPSFFLLDSFSDNVLRGTQNPQLHTPVLFEYAGLTWHGLSFFLVFALLVILKLKEDEFDISAFFRHKRIRNKSLITLGLSFLCLGSFWLINRAFFVAFGIFGLLLGIYFILKAIPPFKLSTKQIVLFLFILSCIAGIGFTQNLFPFFRPIEKLGIAYFDVHTPEDAVSRTSYIRLPSLLFWKQVGVLWLIGGLLAVWKKMYRNPLLLTIIFLFPLWVYFFRTPGADADDLAFTKLLRPLFLLLPVSIYAGSLDRSKFIRLILLALLLLGVLSPIFFFSTARFVGVQQHWKNTDTNLLDLVSHIPSHTEIIGMQTNTQYLLHTLGNTLRIQIEICYEKCGGDASVDYIVQDKSKDLTVVSARQMVYENEIYRLYR